MIKLYEYGNLKREEYTKQNKINSEDIAMFWEEACIQLDPLNS